MLFETYDKLIISIARNYAKRVYILDWEDLYQECKIRIFIKLKENGDKNIKDMKSYITKLCINCCLNKIRDFTHNYVDYDIISLEGRSESDFHKNVIQKFH